MLLGDGTSYACHAMRLREKVVKQRGFANEEGRERYEAHRRRDSGRRFPPWPWAGEAEGGDLPGCEEVRPGVRQRPSPKILARTHGRRRIPGGRPEMDARAKSLGENRPEYLRRLRGRAKGNRAGSRSRPRRRMRRSRGGGAAGSRVFRKHEFRFRRLSFACPALPVRPAGSDVRQEDQAPAGFHRNTLRRRRWRVPHRPGAAQSRACTRIQVDV